MLQDKAENTIFRWLSKIEELIVGLLLSSILLFSLMQIVLRNFFDYGIIWSDSLLRILVLWLGLTGAILASKYGKQINIDILSQFVPNKNKHYIKKITDLFAAIICFVISFYSLQFVVLEYESGSYAFESIPAWITEAIIPLGFLNLGTKYLLSIFIINKIPSNVE